MAKKIKLRVLASVEWQKQEFCLLYFTCYMVYIVAFTRELNYTCIYVILFIVGRL